MLGVDFTNIFSRFFACRARMEIGNHSFFFFLDRRNEHNEEVRKNTHKTCTLLSAHVCYWTSEAYSFHSSFEWRAFYSNIQHAFSKSICARVCFNVNKPTEFDYIICWLHLSGIVGHQCLHRCHVRQCFFSVFIQWIKKRKIYSDRYDGRRDGGEKQITEYRLSLFAFECRMNHFDFVCLFILNLNYVLNQFIMGLKWLCWLRWAAVLWLWYFN